MMIPIRPLWRPLVYASPFLLAPIASADLNTLEVWGNAVGTTPPASLTETVPGTYEIAGGGADLWGGSDQGVFAWDNTGGMTTTGDFTATVRHVSTTEPAPQWGRDTISVRATQTPGGGPLANDAHYMTVRRSAGDFTTGRRETVGGGTTRDQDPATAGDQPNFAPSFGSVTNTGAFLAIARNGNTLHSSYARDLNNSGVAGRYVQYDSRDIAAFAGGNEVIVGLGHQSHPQTGGGGADGVNTGTFDSLTYQTSYDANTFGAAASAGTWQVESSVNVNASTGEVMGTAFVREAGVATGENTGWTVTAQRLDTFVPSFGAAGSQQDPTAMNANDIIPSMNFRLNSSSAAGSGLNADIYLAANGNNQTANRATIDGNAPNGTAIIPNVDWTGGGDNDANYNGLSGPASFAVAVQGVDPADGAAGAFSGNQENYGVHMTGQIFIPADADRTNHEFGGNEWILFEDGIDDYTFLAIDGVTLLDDNSWSSRDGASNGGAHLTVMDVSDPKYDDGEWVDFEMIMWEGGGGDAGVLYWSAFDTDRSFNYGNTPGTFDPAITISGIDQVGDENSEGSFGLTLPAGDYLVTAQNVNTGASASSQQLVTVVPEPSVLAIVALSGLACIFRRRRK